MQASQLQEQLWEAGQQVWSCSLRLLAPASCQLWATNSLHPCRYEGSRRLRHSKHRSPLCPRSVTLLVLLLSRSLLRSCPS